MAEAPQFSGVASGRSDSTMSAATRDRVVWTPMRVGLMWLIGTFALFLGVGEVSRVPDMTELVIFIAGTVAAFAAGYWLRVKTWERPPEPPARDDTQSVRRWVTISAIYTGVFGLVFLDAYGASNPASVVDALFNPGDAYFFRLRESHLEEGNVAVQLLTLGAALTTPVVSFTIVFWDKLTVAIRLLALASVILYCSYWVFIGTQKGVGDFASFAAVALLVRAAMGKGVGRRTVAGIVVVGLAFTAYMVFIQADRLVSENTTGGIKPNPVAAAVVGDELGRGVTTTLFYPTHGYLGLAYNLDDTPFEWTTMRGSSRAVDSYWTQYVGGTTEFYDSYPARTEQRTGWPALTYWATIYPWLASDLTWYGAIAFMGFVGWWLARWWMEAIYLRSKLALLLVGQVAIFVAYVPANNQIGITRPGLVAFVTLFGLYYIAKLNDALGRKRHRTSTSVATHRQSNDGQL